MAYKKIRMIAPHHLQGTVLEEYIGKTYTLDLEGGVYVTIKSGDYIGFQCKMGKEWLEKNPDLWEQI